MKLTASFVELKRGYEAKKALIAQRMREFKEVYEQGDEAIFAELCFCIFTAGASARMGLTCIDAIKDIILTGATSEIEARIVGKHRYPKARAGYIIHTRAHLYRAILEGLAYALKHGDIRTEKRNKVKIERLRVSDGEL